MISYSLERPLFHSLYRAIRSDIESGLLKAGSRLPSKRQYALDLQVSLSTVEQALDLLIQEGYVQAVERKGLFVLPGNLCRIREQRFELELLEEDPAADSKDFPASLWFKTMRLVMNRDRDRLIQTSPAPGSARLRNVIAQYLFTHRQMEVQPRQIVIASGAQELYAILCRMFRGSFEVAIEWPCYPVIEQVYSAQGARVEKLPLDENGISLNALNHSQSSFLHVSPFSSFPLSVIASASRRRRYLHWIESRSGYLIEDDYNSEFFQNGPVLRTLYSMDRSHRVIYLNTFSHSLSSSLRLGYMVLPFELIERYEQSTGPLACTVTMLEQYTLAEFIENGSFERLIARRRRRLVQNSD